MTCCSRSASHSFQVDLETIAKMIAPLQNCQCASAAGPCSVCTAPAAAGNMISGG